MRIDISNYKILILTIVLLFLGCAQTPHFVIQNKTDKVIEIQLYYDSINLNLSRIVANDFKESYRNDEINWQIYEHDTLFHQIVEGKKVDFVRDYCYDTLRLHQIIYGFLNVEELGSEIPFQEKFPYFSKKLHYRDKLALYDYYLKDSVYIERLINKNIVTIFIPPNQVFYNCCQSCNITESFPNVKKIEVIIAEDDIVTLTPKNFKRIMRKENFKGQDNSRILFIE